MQAEHPLPNRAEAAALNAWSKCHTTDGIFGLMQAHTSLNGWKPPNVASETVRKKNRGVGIERRRECSRRHEPMASLRVPVGSWLTLPTAARVIAQECRTIGGKGGGQPFAFASP